MPAPPIYTLHDSSSGRTLTVEVDSGEARVRIDAPGLPSMSIPVEAADLIEAAGALSTWELARAESEVDAEP